MRIVCHHVLLSAAIFSISLCCAEKARGQDHSNHSHEKTSLHFSHPLVSESPSPDTKFRMNDSFANEPGEAGGAGADRNTFSIEAEYAFAHWLSIEVNAPYTFLMPDEGKSTDRVDVMEIGLKYANFTFADHGLLLGGGIELGLPTGKAETGIGSEHVLEIEPFVDFGYKHDLWEIVGFTSFAVPVNENEEDGADFEIGWNLSTLYHLTSRIETLLEFDGENVFGGEEDGVFIVNITPGFKIRPAAASDVQIGVGLSLPLTTEREFNARPILSAFYHF